MERSDVRRALVGAIEKWEKIVVLEGIDEMTSNCPLCRLFVRNFDATVDCYFEGHSCPVYAKTGRKGCADSPYIAWSEHHCQDHGHRYSDHYQVLCPECKKLAIVMRDFLKELLVEFDSEK
jgi:hypothetical protein